MKSTTDESPHVCMDESQVFELTKRLDAIIRLMALSLPSDMTQQAKIVLLAESGFRQKEIAVVLGTTPGTVNTALQRSKSGSPKKVELQKDISKEE